jgi:cytochrome c peroxidase
MTMNRKNALLPVLLLVGFMVTGCTQAKEVQQDTTRVGPGGATPYELNYPLGLSRDGAVIPPDNPMTLEKVKLGRKLFFEESLSLDGSISCATCHIPEKGFSSPEQFSAGVGGKKGSRHAPTIINRVYSAAQFWDGRASSLEDQALGPVQNPVEMGMPDMRLVLETLQKDSSYVQAFKSAFPPDGAITADRVAKAIACFERTILSGNSPFDRFMAGDKTAMGEAAQRGLKLFRDENKGDCETCHVGANFTDENYNNLGIGMKAARPDLGRYEASRLEGHQGAFKTPTLRDISRRGPYMHDGSQKTLEEVVAFYSRGGHPNRWLSPKVKVLRLSQQEQRDLAEFLKALEGEVSWYGRDEARP